MTEFWIADFGFSGNAALRKIRNPQSAMIRPILVVATGRFAVLCAFASLRRKRELSMTAYFSVTCLFDLSGTKNYPALEMKRKIFADDKTAANAKEVLRQEEICVEEAGGNTTLHSMARRMVLNER